MISLTALTVLVATFLVVFGVRTLLQYRRTGDTGWRSPTRSADPAQWWSRILMGAGFVALLAAPILDVADVVPVLITHSSVRVLGLVLAVVAAGAVLAAQLGMGTSWRIGVDSGERTTLVTSGAFAIVRNPIFTAVIGFCVGQALAVPNPISIAGLVLAVTGVAWQVRTVEEPYLRRTHGSAYTDYAARVGRFLPGIGRLR